VGGSSNEGADARQEFGRDSVGLVAVNRVNGSVHVVVGHSEFPFIGLPRPEAGGWRALDDRVRDVEFAGELVDLSLQEAADGQEVRCPIAVLGAVAQEDFGAVARAADEVAACGGQVVLCDHPEPWFDVCRDERRRFGQNVHQLAIGLGEVQLDALDPQICTE
jgi:hypothetical protein